MTTTRTTTQPAGPRADRPAAAPQRPTGQRPGDAGRRRPQREASTWESRSDARSLDPDAPTGPVSGVLSLLLGGLELFAALSSWMGTSDD